MSLKNKLIAGVGAITVFALGVASTASAGLVTDPLGKQGHSNTTGVR